MKVFYINLDERDDRKKFIKSQFDDLKIDGERISAVKKNDAIAISQKNDLKLKPSEISITLSHIKCWEEILNQNIEQAIILEDDALLSKNFDAIIKRIECSNINFDLIRLEVRETNNLLFALPIWKTNSPHQYKLCRCYTKVTGLAGYIISSNFIRKIINSELLFSKPIDLALFGDDSIFFNHYKIYHIKPGLVTQLDQINNMNYSKIQKSDNDKKAVTNDEELYIHIKTNSKIINELLRPFNQLINFIFISKEIFRILILQKRLSLNLIYKSTISLIKFKNRILRLAQIKAKIEKNYFL
jgi:GR25 family glycosyltransferase involved in LPS biosynthesis